MTPARARFPLQKDTLFAAILASIAFGVYLRTMAPSITFGEGPELTTAAWLGGVARPTGYPTYTMLGWLFTHVVRIGSVAYRMNLLSGLCGAAAVAVVYFLAKEIVRRRVFAAAATLLFAFSGTFWSQCVQAEVYAAHVLIAAGVLLCALRWDRTGRPRWLVGGALLFGIGLTHHLQILLLIPGLTTFLLTSRRRAELLRATPTIVGMVGAPLILYVYLLAAGDRFLPSNWGYPGTLHGFRYHVSGAYYHRFVADATSLWANVVEYGGWPIEDVNPGYLLSQFSISILWLAVWGMWSLWRSRRRECLLTLLTYAAVTTWGLIHAGVDREPFYLLSHLVVALWIGRGLRELGAALRRLWKRMRVPRRSRRRLGAAFGAAALVLPVIPVQTTWMSVDHSHNATARAVYEAMLQRVKPNAMIIASGDKWLGPAVYGRYVERMRPDVLVIPARTLVDPGNLRAAKRLEREGVRIQPPARYTNSTPGKPEWSLFAVLVPDIVRQRPVYLAGPALLAGATRPDVRTAIPHMDRVASGEPFVEVTAVSKSPHF